MRHLPTLVAAWIMLFYAATAAVYFVDPERGTPGGTGLSPGDAFDKVSRALALCQGAASDEIRVVPGPGPIREEIVITGKKYTAANPLILDFGNRWITGTEPVDPAKWVSVEKGLWKIPGYLNEVPFSFLVLIGRRETMGRGRIWPTNRLPRAAELGDFQWTTEGNDLILKLPMGTTPALVSVERAHRATGISFGGNASTSVTVRNARIKFATNDGINLHGPREGEVTRGIRFENVRSDFNWDQGISSHDGCESTVEDGIMVGNVGGLVHIDSSKTLHRRLLLAEGGRYDLFFYGRAQATFEDCFVHSTTADRGIRFFEKSMTEGARFVFSNSVFERSPRHAGPWTFALGGIDFSLIASTFWLDGTGSMDVAPVAGPGQGELNACLVRAKAGDLVMNWGPEAKVQVATSLFDQASIGLGGKAFRPGEGKELRASGFADGRSGFCKRLEPGLFPGAERLEGVGACLSPSMVEKVRLFRTGELMGGGFALLWAEKAGGTLRLTFNRQVDPLSFRGGFQVKRKGAAIKAVVRQQGMGNEIVLEGLEPDDRVDLTGELRSDLGPLGLVNPGAL